ncbi:hypothetical protein, partial [Staphylococcus pseudintermedius]|uniref:hypothetical protein n=1 Tax=Staphylococcus pseudintermedius TaxID=283734 RepID=UPI000D944867
NCNEKKKEKSLSKCRKTENGVNKKRNNGLKKVTKNLTGSVDKEIKELNGEWEGYDGNKLKLIIKNDSMNIIEYDDYSTKEEAEKNLIKPK